jgi:hypothetical protein
LVLGAGRGFGQGGSGSNNPEAALLGQIGSAKDRGGDKWLIAARMLGSELLAEGHADGGKRNVYGAAGQGVQNSLFAEENGLVSGVVKERSENGIGPKDGRGGRVGDRDAGESFSTGAGAVPDSELVTGGDEATHHWSSHLAET